jgi:hypothetical protein
LKDSGIFIKNRDQNEKGHLELLDQIQKNAAKMLDKFKK